MLEAAFKEGTALEKAYGESMAKMNRPVENDALQITK